MVSDSPLAPPRVILHEAVLAEARTGRQDNFPLLLCGESAQAIADANPNIPVILKPGSPDAGDVAVLAARRLANDEADSVHGLEPLYVALTPVG